MRMLLLTAALVAPMAAWADDHLPVNAAARLAVNHSGNHQRSQVSQGNSSGTSLDNASAAAATPEQSNYALMFGGLAVVGFVARRRRPR